MLKEVMVCLDGDEWKFPAEKKLWRFKLLKLFKYLSKKSMNHLRVN